MIESSDDTEEEQRVNDSDDELPAFVPDGVSVGGSEDETRDPGVEAPDIDVDGDNEFAADAPDDGPEIDFDGIELPDRDDRGDGDDGDDGDGDDELTVDFNLGWEPGEYEYDVQGPTVTGIDEYGVVIDEDETPVRFKSPFIVPNPRIKNVESVAIYSNALPRDVHTVADIAEMTADELESTIESADLILDHPRTRVCRRLLDALDHLDPDAVDRDVGVEDVEDAREMIRGELTGDGDEVDILLVETEVFDDGSLVEKWEDRGITSCRDVLDAGIVDIVRNSSVGNPVDVAEDLCCAVSELPDVDLELDDLDRAHELYWDRVDILYDSYGDGGNQSKDDMRVAIVDAFDQERDWMSIAERSEEGLQGHTDLWVWDEDEGKWVDDTGDTIAAKIEDRCPALYSKSFVKQIIDQIGIRNRVPEESINGGNIDGTVVPVSNGYIRIDEIEYDPETMTIDPDSVELHEIQKENRFTRRISTPWDPDGADLHGFDEWFGTLMPLKNDARVMADWIGHALDPGYPDDGWLVLTGGGENGKSEVLKTIKAMIGEDDCASVTLEEIQNQKWRRQLIADAQVNIDEELNGTSLDDISLLKKASAGEEIPISKKYESPYSVENTATMIFASDDPPTFNVKENRALKRRVYPIEFPCEFKSDPDPDDPHELLAAPKDAMDDMLRSDARLKAMLIRGIEGLVRIKREGGITDEMTLDERYARYQAYSDPIEHFGALCLEPAERDGTMIGYDAVAQVFERFAERNDHPSKSPKRIVSTLKKMHLPVTSARSYQWTDDDDRDKVVRGVRFTAYAWREFIDNDTDAWTDRDVVDDSAMHDDDGEPTGEDTDPVGVTEQVVDADDVGSIRAAIREIVTDPERQGEHGYVKMDVIRAALEEEYGIEPRDTVFENALQRLCKNGELMAPASKVERSDKFKAL